MGGLDAMPRGSAGVPLVELRDVSKHFGGVCVPEYVKGFALWERDVGGFV